MKATASIPLLLLFLVGCSAGAGRVAETTEPAATNAPAAAERAARVDALLARWDRAGRPGAAVMVVRDGRVLHARGYGSARLSPRTPFTPETPSMIGSVTKQFTAMAVMMLAEEGKLAYDDPLTKFFPGLPPQRHAVTLRHLLNHTSGLPSYEKFLERRKAKAAEGPPAQELVLAYLRQPGRRFAPGDRWEYSNGGYVVLSHVIAAVAGEPYPDFMRRRVIQPLGMNDTFFAHEPRVRSPRRAVGYFREWYGLKVSEYLPSMRMYVGAGSLFSTLEDLRKWEQALGDGTLVNPATLEEALEPGLLNDGSPLMYAAGWEVYSHKGVPYRIHPGGWGGFKSFVLTFPRQRFAVIALSNSGQFDIRGLPLEIARIYLGGDISVPRKIVTAD